MSQATINKGVWQGWHWRYIGGTVLALAILQAVAWVWGHVSLVQTGEFAMMIIVGFVGPRVQSKRLANTLAGVIASWILSLVLQAIFFSGALFMQFIWVNLAILAIGLIVSYFFDKITSWSERKRSEMDAKKRVEAKSSADSSDKPKVRVHRKKKRRR